MVPTLVENLCTCLLTFFESIIMIMIEIQHSGTGTHALMLHQNNGTTYPTYVFIIWKEDTSLPIMQQYKSTTVWKELLQSKWPLWKLQTISITNGSHHMPTTKSTLFAESKDEWEGTGKSMKNALHVQPVVWQKAPLRLKRRRLVKMKPVALAIVELCEFEGIRQAVS